MCVGTEVHFDGSGSRDFDGVVNRFSWNFGDGTVGGGEQPVHVYDQPGDYRVLLTIEGEQAGQCDNTNSDEIIVKAVEAAGCAHRSTGERASWQPRDVRCQRLVQRSRADRRLAVGLWRWQHRDGTGRRANLRQGGTIFRDPRDSGPRAARPAAATSPRSMPS